MSAESPVTSATMSANERRSVGVVALISMIRMFGLFALLPVLSPYANNMQGATSLLVGLAVGAYGLTAAGCQIPLGMLSDRIGRIPVIMLGLGIFAAGSIVAALSDSIHGIIAGRLLQGAGAISAALTALIADATREQVRTRSMAVFGIGIGLSFALAMALGPWVAATVGVPALFWVTALLAVFAASLVWLLPDVPRASKRESWSILPALRADLLRIDAYVFLLHTIMTATFVALPFLFIDRLDMPSTGYWKMIIGALLVSLLITVPMVMQDHKQRRSHFLGISVALIALAHVGLTFFSFGPLPIFIFLVIYFGGFNFLEAGLPARLSAMADESLRGASLGVFSTAQFLGAFVGGLIGGRFMGAGRPQDVFFVCALLAGIWLAMQGLRRSDRP